MPAQDEVRLVVPADPQYVRVARLVASALASSASFDSDAVSDVRMAVDELCAALLEMTDAGLDLRFRVAGESVAVEGVTTGPAPAPPDPMRMHLARRILAGVADDYELGRVDGRACFRLTKRSPRS